MWTWLGNLIAGPLLGKALDAYKAKLAAGNTSEKIAADLAARSLAVDQREAELQAQIVVAEQGNWMTRCVRPLWSLPFILWTWKVVVWDIMLGLGSTPELKGITANLCLLVAGAYFIGRSGEKIASIIKK